MIRLAGAARIPVVNTRTNLNHPCEVLADLTFVRVERGSINDLRVAFAGESTNLCRTWFEAATQPPIEVTQICPEGFEIDAAHLSQMREHAKGSLSHDLDQSVRGADPMYTDCWPRRASEAETRAGVVYKAKEYLVHAQNAVLSHLLK